MSELLRRITRQISPYHNPEGFTFDKGRLFGETRRKSQATPKQMPDVLALALVEKLGDELKQDVEHIERPVVTRRKPRKPKNEADDKGKSRARLTKSKVAALVHEASAVQEKKNNPIVELPVRRNGRVKSENFVRHAKVHKKVFKGHSQSSQDREEDAISISYPATEVVGHGSFGVVFTTQVRETGDRVAIKKVLQDRRFKNRELEIMKQLQHPQVVDLKYYFYETDPQGEVYLNLILEYMPQSLYQRLRHFVSQRSNMPRIEIKLYMYQLAKSLNYLHTNARVCHRDIKPQNLLVDPQTFALKLCDFGSAKQLKPSEPNVSYICSRYYRAPELIFGASNYTVQIDIWSSGCVMAELILGQPMFPGESGIDQLVEIIKILGTPTKQEICSMNPNYMEHKFPQIRPIPLAKVFKREDDETIRFLFDVLRYDPTERYTALQCLCAPYFDELRTTQDAELLAVIKNLKLMEFSDEMEFSTLSPQEASEAKARLLP